jgi:hypothetical protein
VTREDPRLADGGRAVSGPERRTNHLELRSEIPMIRIATVVALVAASLLAPGSAQAREQVPTQEEQAKEPSIVGTWAGKLTQQGITTTITVTLKADGTYKTVTYQRK